MRFSLPYGLISPVRALIREGARRVQEFTPSRLAAQIFSFLCDFAPRGDRCCGNNGSMSSLTRILVAVLCVSPCLGAAQSLTVNEAFLPGKYVPMSGHDRLQEWWKEDGGSLTIHVEAVSIAATAFTFDTPPEWGRNAGGFARMLGNGYGRAAIQNTTYDGMAAALRTDTRYFACGCKGFFPRVGHALEMTFVTYNRNGNKTLDLAQLSGAYGASMIGTLWYPPHYSPLVQGVQAGHIDVGVLGGLHVMQEFSPEIRRMFHMKAQESGH
jgi:hypothetical protein